MFNLLYYGDGIRLRDISNILKTEPGKVFAKAQLLEKNKLIYLKK